MRHTQLLFDMAYKLALDAPDAEGNRAHILNIADYLRAGGNAAKADVLSWAIGLNDNDDAEQTFSKTFFDEEMQAFNRPTVSKNSSFVDYWLEKAREQA